MSKDIEEADPHVPQNPSKGFFYSRTPMLLVDARGRVGDVNAALRVLMGKDLAGCEGQGHEFLSARLGSRLDGELFPADGVARTCATVAGSRKRPMYDEIRVAETLCRYRSPEFGLADLSADEVPCIGTATGVLLGSVLNVAVLRLEGAAAYQAALRKRWTHEILWAIYASSYDAIILKLPFYQEVLDRHLAAMRRRDIARVVDIGAGTVTVTVALVKEGKSVTAVDVCRAMLEKLYSKLGGGSARNLTVIEDTAECLPQLADASFDGVTALNSFFDMEDPYAAPGRQFGYYGRGGLSSSQTLKRASMQSGSRRSRSVTHRAGVVRLASRRLAQGPECDTRPSRDDRVQAGPRPEVIPEAAMACGGDLRDLEQTGVR